MRSRRDPREVAPRARLGRSAAISLMLAQRVRRRPLRYRPHLDGLRTIAVYAVLAFHAGLGGFAGGFIGVDVFFVLSGFLVTSILIRDLAASSHVDYRRFYAGRVRRILPAAIITLCVSAVAYAAVATPSEMLDVLGGFRASCLYVANWFFIRQSTNYFVSNVNASPVLHFWSLAVEEQFYLLWPLLLGGLYVATARARRWRWWLLRGLVAAAVMASAIEAWRIAGSNLERAYYGTDTRAYQLLAGALLALTPQLMHAKRRAKRALPALMTVLLAGLVVVASSALDVGPITRGLFATGLAALLIVALGALGRRVRQEAPLVGAGGLSRSTVVWHLSLALAGDRDRGPRATHRPGHALRDDVCDFDRTRGAQLPLRRASAPDFPDRRSLQATHRRSGHPLEHRGRARVPAGGPRPQSKCRRRGIREDP